MTRHDPVDAVAVDPATSTGVPPLVPPPAPGDLARRADRLPVSPAPDTSTSRPRPVPPWRWSLWRLRPPALVYVLVVDLLAVGLGVALALPHAVTVADLRTALLLALGAAVHIEASRGLERRREVEAGGRPYVELKSLWSFAGLLLLPLGPALVLVVFTFVYWWLRVSRRPVPHRWTFSAATVVLASCAAVGVVGLLPGPEGRHVLLAGPVGLLLIALAAVVRWLVNAGLVVGAITLSAPTTTWAQRLGSPADMLTGLGALAMGAALAALAATDPWLVPVLLLPVLGMQRGFLVGQFARAARTDGKTGLATAAHWRDLAHARTAAVRRRRGGLGVLMIDLDEFKAVNDRHGHLVGDQVLACVGAALRQEVRADDPVGRFGGEEFVVLVGDVAPAEVGAVAERIRRRITGCAVTAAGTDADVRGLTVSVGVATAPALVADLDTLLVAADTALLAAKRGGRDRVEFAVGG